MNPAPIWCRSTNSLSGAFSSFVSSFMTSMRERARGGGCQSFFVFACFSLDFAVVRKAGLTRCCCCLPSSGSPTVCSNPWKCWASSLMICTSSLVLSLAQSSLTCLLPAGLAEYRNGGLFLDTGVVRTSHTHTRSFTASFVCSFLVS